MPFSQRTRLIVTSLAAAFAAAPAAATLHEVGPGLAFDEIADVPWATLQPGDEVRIHWRPEPYREKWVIGRAGTQQAPIVVRGVPGPGGERPVVSGDGASTPDPLDFTNDRRGVIKIGSSNVPPDTLPEHLVVEGLEVRSAHPAYSFTDDHGSSTTYLANAAAIYVERARHLVIRDCVLHDSGNGLFIGAFDGDTQDVLVESDWIHGNGNVGSAFEHNAYGAAIGIIYQANRFGPLRPGAGGNNLKDRSAGLVVRWNWIEGGNRQLDLVDAEDSDVLVSHPSYGETFVYGNVLVEPDGAGNSQIVHYGGDSGVAEIYRKGTLHFFHNTVVSLRSGNTTLLRLSTDDEHADVRNNVLYVTASGSRLALLDSAGVLDLSHNWLKPGWVDSHGSLSGAIDDDGTQLEGDTPGFADEAAQEFSLLVDSDAVDAGAALHPDVLPDHEVLRQYVRHQASEARPADAAPDLGAFEVPEPAAALGTVTALAAVLALARRRRLSPSGVRCDGVGILGSGRKGGRIARTPAHEPTPVGIAAHADELAERGALAVDGCARELFHDRADHTFVRDDECAARRRGEQPIEPAPDALAERGTALAARVLEAGLPGPPVLEGRGVRGADLLRRHALPASEVDLAEIRLELHGSAAGDEPRRAPRAAERARHDQIDELAVEPAGDRAHLLAALCGEIHVGRAVEAHARVSLRLPVADEHDATQSGHGGGKIPNPPEAVNAGSRCRGLPGPGIPGRARGRVW